MLTAVILDRILNTLLYFTSKWSSSNVTNTVFHVFIGTIISILWYSFYLFSPLAYGMEETPGNLPNSTVHHLKWIDSWEF